MNIGVIGLGLIGGSMAKAIKEATSHVVYGYDKNSDVIRKALMDNAIDLSLEANLPSCDIVIIALYPEASVNFIKENICKLKKDTIVVDCCGIKQWVCQRLFPLANKGNFHFVGGHPMAGTEKWGFDSSRASLFKGASMILTPSPEEKEEVLRVLKDLFLALGFSKVKLSTPEEHDRIIAYTSQLAHVLSGAYVKSPSALAHRGFSSGSFKDMTRVAKLNEDMWCELFMENKEYLREEIDSLIERLTPYSKALKEGDEKSLKELLLEGRLRKENLERETHYEKSEN